MDRLARWLAEGVAPAEVEGTHYRRIVEVLTVGRLFLATSVVAASFLFGPSRAQSVRFAILVAVVFLPYVVLHLWTSKRSRAGPLVRVVLLAWDVGIVVLFTWHFPVLRPLAPYAYLLVVAFQTAMAGFAAGALVTVLAAAGSAVAWSPDLDSALERAAFVATLFTMAFLIGGIGRQRNRAARSAKESEALMREAQALAHLGSWRWDVDADRVTWTDELYRIYGLEPGESPPSFDAYLSRVLSDDREQVRESVERSFVTGRPFEHDYRIVRPDGEIRWTHARGETVAGEGGRVTALRGYCQDITVRKRAEEIVAEALEQQQLISDQLGELNRMKDAFLVAVSHELRTPLTAVLGFTHMLDQSWSSLDEEQRLDIVRRLAANSRRLDRLVMNVLDLDRLTRGIIEARRRPTDLRELIERVCGGIDLGGRAVELATPEIVANIDPGLVERILENLLANAVRHTPAGRPVAVRVEATEGGVVLTVDDSGPGVRDELKETIFEPFRQGDTPSHAPGTGLGLAIVDRFARLHHGRAWVEDGAAGGSSFRVFLASDDGLEIMARERAASIRERHGPETSRP